MKRQSLLKFYIGNKILERHLPVLIVVADDQKWQPFGEYYVFTGVTKLPLISQKNTFCADKEGIDPDFKYENFPNLFSTEAVLKYQFRAARWQMETDLSEADRNRYMGVFWNGQLFEFTETDKSVLLQLWTLGTYETALRKMVSYTSSESLRGVLKELLVLPKVEVKSAPPLRLE